MSNKAFFFFKSVRTLNSHKAKCMETDLTQGNHERRVEQTQICPVCVVHYSPGKDTHLSEATNTAGYSCSSFYFIISEKET